MTASTAQEAPPEPQARLNRRLATFQRPVAWRSAWQLASTLGVFAAAWAAAYWSLSVSYALTLLIAVPASGILLRILVLQHDLGHGSLFTSRRVNDAIGSLLSPLTLLPYHHWRRIHNIHHRHSTNLDERGPGYITTLTVREYQALSRRGKLQYRLYRHPVILLTVGGLYYFLVQHRVAYDAAKSWRTERLGVQLTNLAIVALAVFGAVAVGWRAFVAVHLPIVTVYTSVSVWILLNQHTFVRAQWMRGPEWDFLRSALDGSSYYPLPRVLQWFTGSIGFHHVHHLSPSIPNYHLQRCHETIPELRSVEPLTWRESLNTLRLALWDEEQGRLVGFHRADASLAAVPD